MYLAGSGTPSAVIATTNVRREYEQEKQAVGKLAEEAAINMWRVRGSCLEAIWENQAKGETQI